MKWLWEGVWAKITAAIVLAISTALIGWFSNISIPVPTVKWTEEDRLAIVEEASAFSHSNVLSVGYWVLDKSSDKWVCAYSLDTLPYDFCMQTGEFDNTEFVRSFQNRLENEDTIIVTIRPDGATFEKYWIGLYKSVFGPDESMWGEPMYVIYYQVGNTDDTRRVVYTTDKSYAVDGRKFTTHYLELILETI